jgi:hypothetical protein
VFNNFVRAWGHQFIYDHATLALIVERAGFVDLVWPPIGQSRHTDLCGLESLSRLPDGFLEMESMILEGTKPCQR